MIRNLNQDEVNSIKDRLENIIKIKAIYDRYDKKNNCFDKDMTYDDAENLISYYEKLNLDEIPKSLYKCVSLYIKNTEIFQKYLNFEMTLNDAFEFYMNYTKNIMHNHKALINEVMMGYLKKENIVDREVLKEIQSISFNMDSISESQIEEAEYETDITDCTETLFKIIQNIANKKSIEVDYISLYDIVAEDTVDECFKEIKKNADGEYLEEEKEYVLDNFYDYFGDDMSIICLKNVKVPEEIINTLNVKYQRNDRFYYSVEWFSEDNGNFYISVPDSVFFYLMRRELMIALIYTIICSISN